MESSHYVGGTITFIALFRQIYTINKSAWKESVNTACDILSAVFFCKHYDVTKRESLFTLEYTPLYKNAQKERKNI